MRRAALCLTLALLTPLALSTPVAADHAGVHIAELLPAPATGEREFIELWNDGTGIDLSGWTISDEAGTTYTFQNTSLPQGGRIVLWGGGVADARGPAWSRASVWNNGGDQAILKDAAGNIVDVFAYGSSAWPDGRSQPVPAAPPVGRSLSLVDGAWQETAPTPGTPTTSAGGSASATVQNVAPTVSLIGPDDAQAGSILTLAVSVHDDNGDDDVDAWTLHADGALVANGSSGDHVLNLSAPVDRDTWTFTLSATDHAGNIATAEHVVSLRVAGLVIIMPPQGLAFPAFPPGAAEVITNASFTLRNDSPDPLTPRIDVSDLVGPQTIPVAGRLDIGNTNWTTYDGPLTSLPALQPGEAVDLRLRLRDLPAPLPAGAYGTSFTVIA